MFKRFYPDYRYNTVKDIPDSVFTENNIQFAVLDIDNTLVPYTSPLPDAKALEFLSRLDGLGIKYVFVSNNNEDRVRLFCDNIKNAKYIAKAQKPFLKKIKKAMKGLGANNDNTVLIGDQVFTDIYAAKRARLLSIMVNPLEAKETPFFSIKRKLERIVLKNYKSQ